MARLPQPGPAALAALMLLCGAAAPLECTIIRHNDGAAQRVAMGERVRFEGFLFADFERGVSVETRRRYPPPTGSLYDPAKDADWVCADLEFRMDVFPRMQRLSGFPVSVTGTASPNPEHEGACPLFLRHVEVARR
jgi:hypothetical protein